MPKAKQMFAAVAWFCDGLPACDLYSRETAKAVCELWMGLVSTKRRVLFGPPRWSEIKAGDARVPARPTDAPDGGKWLHVERTVIGPWKGPWEVKRAKQIEPPDPVAASSGLFGNELIVFACRDGNLDSIRHLAGAVERAIFDRNRRMRATEARARAEGSEHYTAILLPGEIADSDAGHFVYRLVRACGEHGHAPPPDLIRLLQTFTKQYRPRRGTGPRQRKAPNWLARAKRYWDRTPGARPADLARAAGVNRSTVTRAIQKGRLAAPFVADKESP